MRGFESGTWYGLLAPARTPREVVTRLNRAIVQIVQLPDVREKAQCSGCRADERKHPSRTGEFVRSEIAKWAKRGEGREHPARFS